MAVGNFDGVHIGHARILARLKQRAAEVGGPAVVFTFDPHPVRLLRPDQAPPPLTWTDRKAELLAREGMDGVLAYPTDAALLALTPEQFFEQLIVQLLEAAAMVEGPNFFFGADRRGDIGVLRKLCQQAGATLDVVEPAQCDDGQLVSSSLVRGLIAAGQVGRARTLLTQPYRIRGLVSHGAGRGATIGFPTANLDGVDTLLPGPGVYAGQTEVGGRRWSAAINVGGKPTFGDDRLTVEAHLLDYRGSLYGHVLEVDFLERLRDIQPFANVEELQQQLMRDLQRTREITA